MIMLALFWMFSSPKKVVNKEMPVEECWKYEDIAIKPSVSVVKQDKNETVKNKKPTVYVYGFNIASVGDSVEIKSNAEDKDGNITKYLWKREEKVLSSEANLSFVFSKEGIHTFTLYVTDNLGATAKGSISIDVFAKADKKVFYRHRGCGCRSVSYTYYNSDGNISKEISQGEGGVELKEYQYDNEGRLVQEHLKEYITDEKVQSDITIIYDEFGNQVERFGKETDYDVSSDSERLVSVQSTTLYNEEHNLLEKVNRKDDQITSVVKNSYYKNGESKERRVEEYEDGALDTISIDTDVYDENGNKIKEIRSTKNVETNIEDIYMTEKSYNESGSLLSEKNYQDGKLNDFQTYQYDSEERVIKEVVNGSATHYTYNDKGYISRDKTEHSDGSINLKLFEYNEESQKTETKIDRNGDGYFEEVNLASYDENGKRLSYRLEIDGELKEYSLYHNGEFQENGRASGYTRRYIYDDKGNAVTLLTNYDGRETRTDYRYNSNGERIEERDEDGTVLYSMELKDEE